MELWKAILIGSDRRAQCFGALFQRKSSGECYSCALGAAIEGLTSGDFKFEDLNSVNSRQLYEWFPVLGDWARCPHYPCRGNDNDASIMNTITHLNDHHRWSREKIALEFVKPLEEARGGK